MKALPVAPITAFVGLNGAGKTLAAVESLALSSWAAGRPVVSNLRLFPEAAGFPAEVESPAGPVPLFLPLQSWRQISRLGYLENVEGEPTPALSVTGGLACGLLLDEINALFPARQFGAMPPELVRVLNQLRKQRVSVAWSSPSWASADAELRRVTRMVVVCRGRLADSFKRQRRLGWFPPVQRNEDGRRLLAPEDWRPNRLFRFEAYSAEDFEEFSLDKQRQLSPLWRRRYWRQRHRAHFAYETGAQVALLDHLDHAGICPSCDGSRRRHQCKCSPSSSGGAPAAVGRGAPAEATNGVSL